MKKCCICGAPIEGFGNNPWGAMWKDDKGTLVCPTFKDTDRCCDLCDSVYVIPGRIYAYNLKRKKDNKK